MGIQTCWNEISGATDTSWRCLGSVKIRTEFDKKFGCIYALIKSDKYFLLNWMLSYVGQIL